MTTLILWDLDGTIIDPVDAITGGMADAIEAHGYTRPSPKTMRKFVGPPATYCLENFTDIPQDSHLEVLATYRAKYQIEGIAQSVIYPGVDRVLESFRARGYRQGLATQKPLFMAEKMLKHFELEEFFDVVSGAPDELGTGDQSLPRTKPEIMRVAIEGIAQKFPSEETSCALMVGDRLYDARGARANNLPAVGVAWGFASRQELEQEFDWVVTDAWELERTVIRFVENHL